MRRLTRRVRRGAGRQGRSAGTVSAAVAVVLLPGLTTACAADEDGATRTAGSFLAAWADGDPARAASFTDAPGAAEAELKRLTEELKVTRAVLRPGKKETGKRETGKKRTGDPAAGDRTPGDRTAGQGGAGVRESGLSAGKDAVSVPFDASLTLAGAGTWRYESRVGLRKTGGGWKVHFTPSVLHPELKERTHLVRHREQPPRARILAADGSDVAAPGTVWTVSIWPAKLKDPDRAYKALKNPALGTDLDTAALKARVDKAAPDRSVPVITLREDVYRKVRGTLLPVPGLQFRESGRSLAKTAKALVGTVGPATEETLENAGATAVASDDVGATGLQYRYQKQLAGAPGVTVRIIDKETKEALGEVYRTRPRAGKPVRTTLRPGTQRAAEAALAGLRKNASLVAVQPSTGNVLAVANTPVTGENRAFTGRFAPGSTFKVVSAAALLQAGVAPGSRAPCPRTVSVNGQRFENQAEFELPRGTTFREDFAQSCNTGFIALRDRLEDDALASAAARFGIGGTWDVGASSFDGSVPEPSGENEKAAGMIGQGKTEASTLVMASVAATVKDGSFRQPVLVPGAVKKKHETAEPLSPQVAEQLRTLMRAVVTEGSGRALRGIGGAPAAKTGTAEYGADSPPRTHAWMIGFRGDLAFAVLLEDGGSGGRNAGPVAARFLRELG